MSTTTSSSFVRSFTTRLATVAFLSAVGFWAYNVRDAAYVQTMRTTAVTAMRASAHVYRIATLMIILVDHINRFSVISLHFAVQALIERPNVSFALV